MAANSPKRPAKGPKTARAKKAKAKTSAPVKGPKKATRRTKAPATLTADNPPAGLGPEGLRAWRNFHAELPENWSFDPRELHALEAACRLQDRLAELDAAIDEHGVTVPGSTGQLTVNPALAEFRHCAAAVSKLLGELEIPTGQESAPETAATKRARRAAQVRWRKADNFSREALEHRKRSYGKAN